uniref:Uncharacterized protein n=1 Tax=Oryza barthii TaxID=65489 RepID=A0A0D3GRL5_9ORYZ
MAVLGVARQRGDLGNTVVVGVDDLLHVHEGGEEVILGADVAEAITVCAAVEVQEAEGHLRFGATVGQRQPRSAAWAHHVAVASDGFIAYVRHRRLFRSSTLETLCAMSNNRGARSGAFTIPDRASSSADQWSCMYTVVISSGSSPLEPLCTMLNSRGARSGAFTIPATPHPPPTNGRRRSQRTRQAPASPLRPLYPAMWWGMRSVAKEKDRREVGKREEGEGR